MKFYVAFVALLAIAAAESDADSDPFLQYGYPTHAGVYAQHPAHATAGFQVYSNGAVVPQDTYSVQAAKAQHHSAKAFEYAKKAHVPYLYNPSVYNFGVHRPLVHYAYPGTTHAIYKRDAEPDSNADSSADSQFVYNYGVPNYYHNSVYKTPYVYNTRAYTTYPFVNRYAGIYGNTYATTHGYPSVYRHLFKRDADADSDSDSDSDSQVFYNQHVFPYTSAYSTAYTHPTYAAQTAYAYPTYAAQTAYTYPTYAAQTAYTYPTVAAHSTYTVPFARHYNQAVYKYV